MWFLNVSSGLELVIGIVVRAFIILCILPVHEYAHAWAANKLGDNTAERCGRLTLNPLAHIDWVGAAAIFLVGFGWAKPVPVNPYRFDNQKKRKVGMALTALAGPASNLMVALAALIVLRIIACFGFIGDNAAFYITYAFYFLVSINISLAVFNLLPVYPLDGSRILAAFLPDKYEDFMQRYGQIISTVFVIGIVLGWFDGIISFLVGGITNVITFAVNGLFNLVGLEMANSFSFFLGYFGLV